MVISRLLSRSIWRATIEATSVPEVPLAEAGDPVQHRHRRAVLLDQLGQDGQMGLQPERGRPRRPDAQQARVDPRLQVEAERPHVAQELGG